MAEPRVRYGRIGSPEGVALEDETGAEVLRVAGGAAAAPFIDRGGATFNLRDSGADFTGETDSTAAIQSFLDNLHAEYGGGWSPGVTTEQTRITVTIPSGTLRIGEGITVPPTINWVQQPDSDLVYHGHNGVALRLDAQRQANHSVRVRKSTLAWNQDDDSSVGVQIYNGRWSRVKVWGIYGFATGLELMADGGSNVYNRVDLYRIVNCKRGIRARSLNAGWSNAHAIFGGVVRVDGSYSGVSGTVLFDLADPTVNGFTVVGTTTEGSAHEKTLLVGSSWNVFTGMRFEANRPESIHFLNGATNNHIFSGYGINPSSYNAGGIVRDDNPLKGQNVVWGAFTAMRSLGIYNSVSGSIAPAWEIHGPDFSIRTGNGTADPTRFLRSFGMDRVDLHKSLYVAPGGRVGGGWITLEDGATSIDCSQGSLFRTGNTAPTTIANLSNPLTGQEVTIQAGDSLTTVRSGATVRLSGNQDFQMKEYDTLTLIRMQTGGWVEKSRSSNSAE